MKKPSRAARESVSVITKHYKKMNKEKILLFDTFQTLAGLGFSVNIMRQTAGELPANPDALPDGRIPAAYVIDDDEVYLWNDSASEWVKTDLIQARSFGSILGDPSDNTALQTALDDKASLSSRLVNIEDFGAIASDNSEDESINTQAFKDAQNALPENGGAIIVPAGTYQGLFAVIKKNVTVIGLGASSVLKLPDGYDAMKQTLTIASDFATIRNLKIDGNKGNQDLSSEGSSIAAGDGIGIYASDVTIENCVVKDAMSHGIIAWGDRDHTSHTNSKGEPAANTEVVKAPRRNNQIINNRVINSGTTINPRASIDLASLTGDGDNWCEDSIIHGNTVIGDDGSISGVTLHQARGVIISHNTILMKRNYGINIHDNCFDISVIGNQILPIHDEGNWGAKWGIALRNRLIDGVIISGNYMKSRWGSCMLIRLDGVNSAIIRNIQIKDNHLHYDRGSSSKAAFVVNSDNSPTLENITVSGISHSGDDLKGFYGDDEDIAAIPDSIKLKDVQAITYDGISGAVLRSENSGEATITDGNTNIVIEHGLIQTPSDKDISVTPRNGLGNATQFWISTVGATTFRINVNSDPGAGTARFVWQAQVL